MSFVLGYDFSVKLGPDPAGYYEGETVDLEVKEGENNKTLGMNKVQKTLKNTEKDSSEYNE